MKEKTLNIRINETTYDRIENIKKQLMTTGLYDKEELTNSFIVRLAIRTLDNKAKYFIWNKDGKTACVKEKGLNE